MSSLLEQWRSRADDERAAIVDAEGTHAYRTIAARAASIAASLGPQNGRRVAILAAPGARFVAAFFGILEAGGCVVVLSPLHPPPETRFFCDDAEVSVALVSREHASVELPCATRAIESIPDAVAPRIEVAEDAPALQLYTSGTTGKPKGAVLTHANIAIQQRLVGEAWGFSPDDVLLHSLPLHHMHGLAIALLTALGAGATTHTTTFHAPAIWEAMSNATVFMGVPAMYHRLFAAFDAATDDERARWSENARRLRLATSGSAALPVTLAERWRAVNGNIPLERFGMTEIGVGITNRLHGARFPGCVGFPLPTVETRIVGDDGNDADTGELWIRGPSVFAGYHRREEETKRAFAADGWFKTGDTVTRDASLEGAPFKILGRTSVDILKSGGYKLSALEIEEALREHPSVGEVAVVGLPDEAWGDRVVACVVLRSPCDADTLRSHVRAKLASYKVPKEVRFVTELPKNALGKVVKPDLVKKLGT